MARLVAELDDELIKNFKLKVIEDDSTIKETLEKLIKEYLNENHSK